MAVTMRQIEAVPETYPEITGLIFPLAEGEGAWIWQRIESYIAHRYTARDVIWTVEGGGDWTPPLAPAVVTVAHRWDGVDWITASLSDGPYGYCLPDGGPYSITATVGGGDVPAAVMKAAMRLANYLTVRINSADPQLWATTSKGQGVNVEDGTGIVNTEDSWQRPKDWTANAMQLSGAADLLRPYRRA